MKLRIRGNSIRLRLTKSEVAAIAQTGFVKETTDFGDGKAFGYVLTSSAGKQAKADFSNGTIEIQLPAAVLKNWAESADTQIEAATATLKITVEKDFACLAPRAGDEDADTFPHPFSDRAKC